MRLPVLFAACLVVALATAEKPLQVDDPADAAHKTRSYALPKHDDLHLRRHSQPLSRFIEDAPAVGVTSYSAIPPPVARVRPRKPEHDFSAPVELDEEPTSNGADPLVQKEKEAAERIAKKEAADHVVPGSGAVVYPDGLGDSNQHPPLEKFNGALLKKTIPAEPPRVMYQKAPPPIPNARWEPLNGRGVPNMSAAQGLSPQAAAISQREEEAQEREIEDEREANGVNNILAEKNRKFERSYEAKSSPWANMPRPVGPMSGAATNPIPPNMPIVAPPMMEEHAPAAPAADLKEVDPKLKQGLDQSLQKTDSLFSSIQGDSHAEVSIGSQIEAFLNKEKSLGQTVAAQIGDNARKLATIKAEETANLKQAHDDQGAFKDTQKHLSWEQSKLRGIQQQQQVLQHEYTTDYKQAQLYEQKQKDIEASYDHVVQVQNALESERKNFVGATQKLIGQYDDLQRRYDSVSKSYFQGFGGAAIPQLNRATPEAHAKAGPPSAGAAPHAAANPPAKASAPSMVEHAPAPSAVQPLHESADEIYG